MDAKEAIIELGRIREFKFWGQDKMELVEACISALKKQTPKKPVGIGMFEGKVEHAHCPCCGYSFPDIGGINESYFECEQDACCRECGQKLDWSDI